MSCNGRGFLLLSPDRPQGQPADGRVFNRERLAPGGSLNRFRRPPWLEPYFQEDSFMGLLDGKKAVIFGIANEKSIAWAIAQAFRREGAELAVTYANDTVAKRVKPLAESVGSELVLPCDVRDDDAIRTVFGEIEKAWGGLDILVHSVAFANKDELKGSFLNTTREGFALAMDVSAYSFIALMKEAFPLMKGREASAITLS